MGKTNSFILVPLIIGCAQFMQQFDGNVIATGLPAMAESLHEIPVRLNIAITSYLLTLAIFVPISGWVADRFGARPVFIAAIFVFTLASAFCGMSQTLPELVAARLLQGIGGAMMTPVGRVIVTKSVPKAQLVRAMMYISLPGVLGPVLGPPVGGFIVTFASWRWIFLINIPVGLLGILLSLLYIPAIEEPRPPSFDTVGFTLAGICFTLLMIAFETMGHGLLPEWAVLGLLLAGAGCGLVYLLHARRHSAPLLDLTLLKLPTFSISVLGGAFFYIGAGAAPFLLALLYQVGFGLSAFLSGLMALAMAAGAVIVRVVMNPLLRATGFRQLLIWTAIANGITLIMVGLFRENTSYVLMILVLIPVGFARSVHFTMLGVLPYAEVPVARMSAATSFQSMGAQLCMSFGVGLGAFLLQESQNFRGAPALATPDIAIGFYVMGALSFLGAWSFTRLTPDAGAEMSGRRF